MREGHLVSETVMKRKINRSYNVCLYPNDSISFVFNCFNAFTIDIHKRIIISRSMKQSFSFKELDNPFTSNQNNLISHDLQCNRILVIQYSE